MYSLKSFDKHVYPCCCHCRDVGHVYHPQSFLYLLFPPLIQSSPCFFSSSHFKHFLMHSSIESATFTWLGQYVFCFIFFKVGWRVVFKPRWKNLCPPWKQELMAFNKTLTGHYHRAAGGSCWLGFAPLGLLGSSLRGPRCGLGSSCDSPRISTFLPDLVALICSRYFSKYFKARN